MEINLRFSWFWKCGLWSFRLCHHGYQQVTFRFHKILGISSQECHFQVRAPLFAVISLKAAEGGDAKTQ